MAKLGPSSLPYKIIFGALQFKCTWFGFSKVYFVVQYTSCQLQIDAATQMQKITCAWALFSTINFQISDFFLFFFFPLRWGSCLMWSNVRPPWHLWRCRTNLMVLRTILWAIFATNYWEIALYILASETMH